MAGERLKAKRVKLNALINKISKKAKPLNTTLLIRKMRERDYSEFIL